MLKNKRKREGAWKVKKQEREGKREIPHLWRSFYDLKGHT